MIELECPLCGALNEIEHDTEDGEMIDCHNCNTGLELWQNELLEI